MQPEAQPNTTAEAPGEQVANGPKPGPVCSVCPLFNGCSQICDPVSAILPSMERGRVDAEDLPRLYMGIQMVRTLLENAHRLTPRQQEVVRLYYRESLMQKEIAERLQVTQQAVRDALSRARQTVGRWFREHVREETKRSQRDYRNFSS